MALEKDELEWAKHWIKEEKWCDQCHAKGDCEDKEEFLESDSKTCTYYA